MENQYSEPAFPWAQYDGITIRDYFAAKAMQGWVSTYPDTTEANHAALGAQLIANFAYDIADAMLKARQQ